MPDAGDFEKSSESATPASWAGAFAALPQETPDAGGWQRLQARLPAATPPRVRRHWPLWLAAAASLGLVVALPLWTSHDAAIDLPAAAGVQRTATPQPVIANTRQPATASTPATATHGGGQDDNIATTQGDGNAIATSPPVAKRTRSNQRRVVPAQRPIRTVAEPAGATRLAASDPPTQPIESLYAESAQLEQLLAMVRDERVASGASAALSSELDERVAGIDAELAQAGLATTDRDRLWRQRVDAMQQLVGIETTRMLSARGDSFNASLVSID